MAVRDERETDRDAIRIVHMASFPTADEALLVDALRAAQCLSLSLVAVQDEQIVGHVAFSPVTAEYDAGVNPPGRASPRGGVGLAPLAVLPGYRRRGIAEELVRAGLERCRQAEVGFVVVLGDPAYYRRFGFAAAKQWALQDEYDGGSAFQALELAPGSMPTGAKVRYAPEFAALGV